MSRCLPGRLWRPGTGCWLQLVPSAPASPPAFRLWDSRCSAEATLCAPRIRHREPLFPQHQGSLLKAKFPASSPGRGFRGALPRTTVSGPLCQLFPVPTAGASGRALEVRGTGKGPRCLQPSRGLFPAPSSPLLPCCPPQFPTLRFPLGPATVHSGLAALEEPSQRHTQTCVVWETGSHRPAAAEAAGSSLSTPFPTAAGSRHALVRRDWPPAGAQQPSCVTTAALSRGQAGTALRRSTDISELG